MSMRTKSVDTNLHIVGKQRLMGVDTEVTETIIFNQS